MDKDEESNFAESVQRLREARDWSQGELARRMVEAGWKTYSQMTVSRTEKQDRPIRLGEAFALARIFEVDLSLMTAGLDSTQEALGKMRDARRALIAVHRSIDAAYNAAQEAMAFAEGQHFDEKSDEARWARALARDLTRLAGSLRVMDPGVLPPIRGLEEDDEHQATS